MNWKARFKLKDLITEADIDDEHVCVSATEVMIRLNVHRVFSKEVREELIDMFNNAIGQDELNDALALLYDAADNEGVWIE